MPKMNVKKSITINTPKAKVKEFLTDFHNWKNWSPWLICEPEAALQFAEDGKYYKWEGTRVGTGEMKVTAIKENQIDYDLTFLKPWKSQAKVNFNIQESSEGTKVEWTMNSALPFFMFWMKKSMETYVGMDYDRGLKMMKEELEEGKINSQLEFVGTTNFEACNFIGIKRDTAFSDIDKVMEKDFTALNDYLKEHSVEVTGYPFSEYQKFDLVKDKVVYVAGFPIKEKPENLPTNFFYGNMPPQKMETVRHKGKYDHLGNAWSAIMMMDRSKEFKKNKKANPMEIYVNDPSETSPEDLITDISMPVL